MRNRRNTDKSISSTCLEICSWEFGHVNMKCHTEDCGGLIDCAKEIMGQRDRKEVKAFALDAAGPGSNPWHRIYCPE